MSFRVMRLLVGAFLCSSSVGLAQPAGGDEDPREVVRIATFNMARGLDLERMVRALGEHEHLNTVDVLMIQEVEVRPELDVAERLATDLGLELLYAPARQTAWGSHGLALLSRVALEDFEIVPLPHYDLRYRSRSRIAMGATLSTSEHRLRLYNVHLDTRLTLDERIEQLEPVVARAIHQPRAIVGGDVNTIRALPVLLPLLPLPIPGTAQAVGLDRFMRRRGFETPLAGVGATGPLRMRLDAIYTRGVEVIGKGKAAFPEISDHAALWVDVAVHEKGSTR